MEINIFTSAAFLLLVKTAVLIILFFYVIFALMVIRQVDLMSKTIITTTSKILSAIAIIHAGFAIGLIVLAWGIL
ncbi:MAG: DUF5657 family protein [Patescibacteria group bacterium]